MLHNEKNKRVLGVDLGLKRTGLAISDELGISTRALENLIPRSRAEDIAALRILCEEFNVAVVVFGLPLMPSTQEEGTLAKRFRAFAELFGKDLHEHGLATKVVMLDEAMTSKLAAQRLANSGLAMKKRRSLIDGEAARILVEEYLAGAGGKAE